ncbi:uncharacterized protein BX664DRAFT_322426 [Halteromyces radiatus]|uniref:uncharacterized protein n=1 Tax=Halteromyces radiatus TaxID=101107 RepID=UPI0022207E9B|nr:uncharacterized protein BX664DRAFT_322426 [Halteromyces radiatus]KAI8099926.1 hypothetical protein BX664DRAFT_322426 [Halteromyces radiatus]
MIFSKKLLILNGVFSLIGWLLGFIGLCTAGKSTVRHSWWMTIYNLGLIVLIFGVVCKSKQDMFAPLLLSLVTIGILYNTQEVSFYLENNRLSPFYVTGAGYIILIVAQFMWLVAFGIKDIYTEPTRTTKTEDDDHLFTPQASSNIMPTDMDMAQHQNMLVNDAMNTIYVSPHAEFKIPVVALHAYGANPEDPNELSFEKGEILYVHEKKGSWWQAKKSDCSVGMIPSNYVSCTTSSGY